MIYLKKGQLGLISYTKDCAGLKAMWPVHVQFWDWFLEQTNLSPVKVAKMLYYINTRTEQQCF